MLILSLFSLKYTTQKKAKKTDKKLTLHHMMKNLLNSVSSQYAHGKLSIAGNRKSILKHFNGKKNF